jgi:hypothetical protein
MFEKTNTPGYLIDRSTNLVINNNINEYSAYKKMVDDHKQIEFLKNEIAEIKKLLGK